MSDSLEMARFGRDHAAQTLVVLGRALHGRDGQILSPEKTILMPTSTRTARSISAVPNDFAAFCDQHPDRTVVVYANTSAAVRPGPTGW